MLLNLIRNAIEAMTDDGPRSLMISTAPISEGMVMFTIEDSGSGISPALAQQLFQPFITSKENGMGIGLSICRTIIEAHGGRIWFEPARERGTLFHFTLPLAGDNDEL